MAPAGWHIPTDEEWQELIDYVGGEKVAGGILKETGLAHWGKPNVGATNESRFSALPGGSRIYDGTFNYIGYSGLWWSSTEYVTSVAWCRDMVCSYAGIGKRSESMGSGFSVSCVRD